jgi:hypothetical protein
MKQTSTVVRLLAIGMMVVSLTVVAADPATAQRESQHLTRAQQVRELVLKQREKVLAQIEAIMSGQKAAEGAQIEPAASQEAEAEATEEADSAAESSEPDGGEDEGAEPDGGGEEDGEGEEVDVLELPETGIGPSHGAIGSFPALAAAFGALAMVCLSARRWFTAREHPTVSVSR